MAALVRDPVIADHPHAIRVYVHLSEQLTFGQCRPIKAYVVADALGLKKETVLRALDLLVNRSYLREGARSDNNVRSFQLEWSLPSGSSPERTAPERARE